MTKLLNVIWIYSIRKNNRIKDQKNAFLQRSQVERWKTSKQTWKTSKQLTKQITSLIKLSQSNSLSDHQVMTPVTNKSFKKEEHRGQKNLINWNWRHFHGGFFSGVLLHSGSLEKIFFTVHVNKSLNIFEIVEC